MSDFFLFGVLPYVAMVLFFVMTIYRYRQEKFSYSSLSSQFLENKKHFWGSVPFHYGILVVLGGHVLGFLFPKSILWFNSEPIRLFILEVTGLAFALLTLIGLVNIVLRRWTNTRIRRTTTVGDWIIYGLLLVQIVTGASIAYHHAWGSSWFATSAAPWLQSLVMLQPEISYVAPLPWLVKLHIVNAWLLIGFFPFTRLVHILVIPNMYLWRRPQLVLWNRKRAPGSDA